MKWMVCIATLISPAFAIGISTGGPAAWLVNGNPAVVENPRPANWVPNTGGGSWVGTSSTDGDPAIGNVPGVFVYTLAIGALYGGSGVFNLNYAADNSVAWSITSGTLTGGTATCSGNCFGSFNALSGTLSATSILIATVVNTTAGSTGLIANSAGFAPGSETNSNPTGLFVSGTAEAVPEPATWALLFGGASLLALRKRQGFFHRSRRSLRILFQ